MVVVVRCPVCKGQSRVGPEAVGLTVACPLCQSAFVAAEEPPPPPKSILPPRPRPAESMPPLVVVRAKPRPRAEPVAPPASAVLPKAEPHDPGAEGGLPATVLVGLALLPFLIPLLWVLAPAAAGQDPTLSLAAPTALAIAASALCLAVVYTVDWTPTTRVKGVFILVGLSYFTAVSLFFLKKDMLDRVKRFFGAGAEWKEFRAPPPADYRVKLPGRVVKSGEQPLPGWKLQTFEAKHNSLTGGFRYVVGHGLDHQIHKAADQWFDGAKQSVLEEKGWELRGERGERAVTHQERPGREWVLESSDGVTVRIVQVYRIDNKVYYLSAEGPKLDADADESRTFFDSFLVAIQAPKND